MRVGVGITVIFLKLERFYIFWRFGKLGYFGDLGDLEDLEDFGGFGGSGVLGCMLISWNISASTQSEVEA